MLLNAGIFKKSVMGVTVGFLNCKFLTLLNQDPAQAETSIKLLLQPSLLHPTPAKHGYNNITCVVLDIAHNNVIDGIFTCHVAAQKLVTSKCVGFACLMK